MKQVDGRTHFNHYENYPDCACGRSSRWYSGITETNHKEKFTCIFCSSSTEEGSQVAINLYGTTMGGEHRFFLETPSI